MKILLFVEQWKILGDFDQYVLTFGWRFILMYREYMLEMPSTLTPLPFFYCYPFDLFPLLSNDSE